MTTGLRGQLFIPNDTIKIEEVLISGKKVFFDAPGYKKTIIDTSVLRDYTNRSLAEILSENTGIYIKSYGPGGAATPSFRGTGAGHTMIAWNGININNPMLGQSDLSLMPAGLVDDIHIFYGGASMALNSGGIGGIVNLETKPVWKKETLISMSPGIGSFGRYTGLLKVRTGSSNFQSITKAFFQSSENDFRYLNDAISNVPVWETRKNSQMNQQGFIQELYFLRSENVISARVWYQSANRNLASSMLSPQFVTGESQSDESLRMLLNYDINRQKETYSITGAWLFNRLDYSNPQASIDSKNISDILSLKANIEKRISLYTKIRVNVNEELSIVKSNNYDQTSTRNSATFTASAEHSGAGRIGISLLFREIIDKSTLLIPDFSAGMQVRLVNSKDHFLKVNISRNSKLPTMNDLFWVPGGNPDLKNEYAFMYELTYDMTHKTLTPFTLSYDLTVFRNSIKDMIQWRPGQYAVWTADNIQNVDIKGIESSFSVKYKLNNLISDFKAGYSYTSAIDESTDNSSTQTDRKQLMYIPENQLDLSLRVSYRNFYSSVISNLTGRRYITVDNSRYLPGYCTNSITAGVNLKRKKAVFDLNLNIDNLFDVNYQNIAYYPLPGRNYTLKLMLQFSK
jgi:vitamin B12 transporter